MWLERRMQTTVATLLLVISAVILTTLVIDYCIGVVETTLQVKNSPQLDRLRGLENNILNQTDNLINQTITQPTNQTGP
jgi:hypothetical protein